MILRSKRHRIILGFTFGFLLCLILSGVAFYWYFAVEGDLSQKKLVEVRQQAVDEYIENNPTGLIYILTSDKRSGEVLQDTDFAAAEISVDYLPSDAILDINDAIGKVIRCDVKANTCITSSLIYDEEDYPDDLRIVEYTVINLPEKLEQRQFLDIRIRFPNGLDYIVLSKKEVIDLTNSEDGKQGKVWIYSAEEEILRMASAIVDASMVQGAFLYAVPYVAPDVQKAAYKTYPVNSEVYDLIAENPNIIVKAITELENRNRDLFENLINKMQEGVGKEAVFFQTEIGAGHSFKLPEETSGDIEVAENNANGRL
ncbi:MAG: hypothetical protein GX957_13100 [Clostridiaceae bacterium]|mgnify:CR=1 FL=1|nr:hypothetical protein [Clostridiaceae bacterium]